MKKALLCIVLLLNCITPFAQTRFYYTFAGQQPVYFSVVTGKYTIEFPDGLENAENFYGEWLNGNYYLVTDTSMLDSFATNYIIRPVYITQDATELYEIGELVLKFASGTTETQISEIIEGNGLTLVSGSEIYSLYKSDNPVQVSKNIFESGLVEFCHPNFITRIIPSYIPNDPYFNKQFYLHNTGQVINDGVYGTNDADIDAPEAWNITKGDSNVIVAVTGDGVQANHFDLPNSRQVRLNGSNILGPDFNNPSPSAQSPHETSCAGIIAATQDNNIGISGIAPKCKIMPIRISNSGIGLGTTTQAMIANAMTFADTNGAKVISNSWTFGSGMTPTPVIHAAIQSAIYHNRVVIFATGNTAGTFLGDTGIVLYPANSQIPGLISVGASDQFDSSALYSPKSYFIDIVAPSNRGESCIIPWGSYPNVWTTDMYGSDGYNPWFWDSTALYPQTYCLALPNTPEYLPPLTSIDTTARSFTGRFSGTSAAAPQVAGVAALMFSVNSCLGANQIKDILLNTADKVGGYNYSWNPARSGHSKEMGYGRLNAYKAVLAAQQVHKSTLDLYIKDKPEDFGTGATGAGDKSPDIWVRNQQDGMTVQEHQNPEWNGTAPVYVYVRVRNKSCVASNGVGRLSVYWSKAAGWSSWPQNWNGTQPTIGNMIDSIHLPNLQPGKDTILKFTWTLLDPNIYNNWNSCILARIEGITADPITVFPNHLEQDVSQNNNIAIRNVSIVDVAPGIVLPVIGGQEFPLGNYVYIGNPLSIEGTYNVHFDVPATAHNIITREAEVTLTFDEEGWEIMTNSGALNQTGVTIVPKTTRVILTQPNISFNDITFPAETRIPVYMGFSFLIDSLTDNKIYDYLLTQTFSDTPDVVLGTENFLIRKNPRTHFDVYAGPDRLVDENETITINANTINEAASYYWYDETGEFIYEGQFLSITPTVPHTYTLEVISSVDGFKGYDEVFVDIRRFYINSITPNPATNEFVLDYDADEATTASVIILGSFGQTLYTATLNTEETQTNINITGYQPGIYTVILICNGQVADAAGLSIY